MVLDIKHQEDLSDSQRRFLRAMWLIGEMKEEDVRKAEKERRIEPGTLNFIAMIANLLMDIRNGNKEPDEVTSIVLARLEDAYLWSLPHAHLTVEQQKQVAKWCRKFGHTDLANNVERNIKEQEENLK